jgi:hypothetical protein
VLHTLLAGVNVATTLCAAVIVTTHESELPLHAPLQPPKTKPLDGVAVKVTV